MLTSASRTERHRSDKQKATGIHYTPPEVAEFLAAHALREMDRSPSVVLDPACGGGELLEAVWQALLPHLRPTVRLVGLDTDPVAAEECNDRLRRVGCENRDIQVADFVVPLPQAEAQMSIFEGDGVQPPVSIFEGDHAAVQPASVDLVIANPPYVRTQTLGGATVERLTARYHIAGRIDLYLAFAFAMSEVLRDGGVMALLCSNRFLTTRNGQSLRRLLREQFSVSSIFDFGDTRMFNAAVLPAVVIATKVKRAGPARFVSVYRLDQSPALSAESFKSVPDLIDSEHVGEAEVTGTSVRVRRGELSQDPDPERPWTLETDETRELASRLAKSTSLTIASLTKIRVGIKTTADAVFIREDWSLLPAAVRPEPQLLHTLLTHHVAQRWRANPPRRSILYPHELRGGRTVPIDLAAYPGAAAYLGEHAERLRSRGYVRASGRQWFEIWVPHRADLWKYPKVVFPDIAETPKFFVDTTGSLVNGDCYWATTSSVDEALLIAAIGNSTLARDFYDAQCGNQLYAGRRRFMSQYVERFPIPDPESNGARRIVALARELHCGRSEISEREAELDYLVRRSLGVEESAR